jgi:hypothetical protein
LSPPTIPTRSGRSPGTGPSRTLPSPRKGHGEASGRQRPTNRLIVLALSLSSLWLGFSANVWHASSQDRFLDDLRETESLVVGRLVMTRQGGLLAEGGLPGAGIPGDIHADWISQEQVSDQYSTYLEGSTFENFSPYLSQIGGQAMLYGLLDRVVPLSPRNTLRLFHAIAALLSALALALVVLWFFDEFGMFAAVVVLCSILLSDWLTVFGRNLWWSLWAFYLPMVGVMYYLRRRSAPPADWRRLGALSFLLIAIKCFINGYEFITTTVVMMMVPLVYYDWARRTAVAEFFRRSTAMLVGAAAAIGASLFTLSSQIASATQGSISDGWRHIWYALGKRTYGAGDDYSELVSSSHEASVAEVLGTYVSGAYLDTTQFVSSFRLYRLRFLLEHEVGYAQLLVLFALGSVALVVIGRGSMSEEVRHKSVALVATTWFSITAPLSWYIMFKGHAQIHTHLDYLLWQMPFTLFGFALLGVVVRELAAEALEAARFRSRAATESS